MLKQHLFAARVLGCLHHQQAICHRDQHGDDYTSVMTGISLSFRVGVGVSFRAISLCLILNQVLVAGLVAG